jgi:hypothetical protein
MESSRQGLVLCLLPQEVLDSILEYVLNGMLLEMRGPEDLGQLQINKAALPNSSDLVELNYNLELLKLKLPSRQTLLRHATFAFADLSHGGLNLRDVCHLDVTRDQLEFGWHVYGPASLEGFEFLQTLTVREIMRAGANSATMRSVGYRLEADHLLQCIAGSNAKASDPVGSEKFRCVRNAGQRVKRTLQLRVETWMPLPLMVSTKRKELAD